MAADGTAALPAPVLDGIRAAVQPLPEAVLVADGTGRIQLTNEAADRMFHEQPVRTADDLLSRFEGTDLPNGRGAEAESSTRRTVRPRNQPNTWLLLDRTTLGSSSDTAAVFVLRDVTGTPDLRPEREAFLGVLSHELRTPLTTIYAGSSVLARRPPLSSPATQTLATDINAEAARLYDLIEDLLVIARLERRILEPTMEAVDVGRAIDRAVRMILDRFPQARIGAIGTGSAPRVRGDAGYVEQACRNLLLASFRAAAESKPASITIRVETAPSRDEVAVRVLDPDPVFRPDEVDRLFDLPTAESEGRHAGTGVGLYVARQAVQAMGGRTWAATRAGGGIELGFALRIADEGEDAQHASTAAVEGPGAPPRGLSTP